MKSLNKEAFAGIDYGHILLGLGLWLVLLGTRVFPVV